MHIFLGSRDVPLDNPGPLAFGCSSSAPILDHCWTRSAGRMAGWVSGRWGWVRKNLTWPGEPDDLVAGGKVSGRWGWVRKNLTWPGGPDLLVAGGDSRWVGLGLLLAPTYVTWATSWIACHPHHPTTNVLSQADLLLLWPADVPADFFIFAASNICHQIQIQIQKYETKSRAILRPHLSR